MPGPGRSTRRTALGLFLGGGLSVLGLRLGLPRLLRVGPPRPRSELSPGARALVDAAFADLDPAKAWDVHAHVFGLGVGGTGCWVNPRLRSHLHPLERLRLELYLGASGVRDLAQADEEFVQRLLRLHRDANPSGKLVLMAFERRHRADGTADAAGTGFHTPDRHVLELARRHPDVRACVSIHPYRDGAARILERAIEAGAVAVKWLPNAMGIDPASERCRPFYAVLARHRIPLITHTGIERAVHAEEDQELGNPLRLRAALDAGVVVVAAHCASLGRSRDLDASDAERVQAESFDLFLRLLHDPAHEGRLYGEISALTQVNRCGRPLRELLLAPELHPRLVNGSDYPLPALDPLVSTLSLVREGYLRPAERLLLNEVFEANPLLFDFLVKRRVAVDEGGRRHRFDPIVFETARLFPS